MAQQYDMLRGAALANGLAIEGRSYDELRIALGGVLVDKLLGLSTHTSMPAAAGPKSNGKRPCDGPNAAADAKKKPRSPTAWHAFLKTEKLNVRAGRPDLKGAQVLQECAQRWKLQKTVNAASGPGSSSSTDSDTASSDGAVEGLALELLQSSSPDDIKANLEAVGLPVDGDDAVNAARLAQQMVEL